MNTANHMDSGLAALYTIHVWLSDANERQQRIISMQLYLHYDFIAIAVDFMRIQKKSTRKRNKQSTIQICVSS